MDLKYFNSITLSFRVHFFKDPVGPKIEVGYCSNKCFPRNTDHTIKLELNRFKHFKYFKI